MSTSQIGLIRIQISRVGLINSFWPCLHGQHMCTLCMTSNKLLLCVYVLYFDMCASVHMSNFIIMYKLTYQPIPRWSFSADIHTKTYPCQKFRAGLIKPAVRTHWWWGCGAWGRGGGGGVVGPLESLWRRWGPVGPCNRQAWIYQPPRWLSKSYLARAHMLIRSNTTVVSDMYVSMGQYTWVYMYMQTLCFKR